MRKGIALLGLLVLACNSPHAPKGDYRHVQGLVNRAVEQYPDIVMLSIHAVPTGQDRSRIIACSEAEKIGRASNRQYVEAMQTRSATVVREGMYLDVTVPIRDESGKAIAAAVITFKVPRDTSEEALVNQAKSITREMSKAIQNAGGPTW